MKKKSKSKVDSVELGEGGITFERCEYEMLPVQCSNSRSGVDASLTYLTHQLHLIDAAIKSSGGKISEDQLKAQFRKTPLGKVAKDTFWKDVIADSHPENKKTRGRPAGQALGFLEGKGVQFSRSTMKTYKSRNRARKAKGL